MTSLDATGGFAALHHATVGSRRGRRNIRFVAPRSPTLRRWRSPRPVLPPAPHARPSQTSPIS